MLTYKNIKEKIMSSSSFPYSKKNEITSNFNNFDSNEKQLIYFYFITISNYKIQDKNDIMDIIISIIESNLITLEEKTFLLLNYITDIKLFLTYPLSNDSIKLILNCLRINYIQQTVIENKKYKFLKDVLIKLIFNSNIRVNESNKILIFNNYQNEFKEWLDSCPLDYLIQILVNNRINVQLKQIIIDYIINNNLEVNDKFLGLFDISMLSNDFKNSLFESYKDEINLYIKSGLKKPINFKSKLGIIPIKIVVEYEPLKMIYKDIISNDNCDIFYLIKYIILTGDNNLLNNKFNRIYESFLNNPLLFNYFANYKGEGSIIDGILNNVLISNLNYLFLIDFKNKNSKLFLLFLLNNFDRIDNNLIIEFITNNINKIKKINYDNINKNNLELINNLYTKVFNILPVDLMIKFINPTFKRLNVNVSSLKAKQITSYVVNNETDTIIQFINDESNLYECFKKNKTKRLSLFFKK